VIGADGIHSDTRTAILGGPPSRYVGQAGWRFVVDGFVGIDGWNGWLGPDRGFLALGIGGDRVYCFGDLRTPGPEDPTGGDPVAFARLFDGYPEPVSSLLARLPSPEKLLYSPVEEVVTSTWWRGHLVLIGDAAHATAPNMAEGASLATEDALVLAEALGAARDIPSALAAFIARRQPRVGHVQHMTHRRDRLRYLHPLVRRTVMGTLGHRLFRTHYRPLLSPP
jgi:2-polyprenyl-6-methoxyphenol hydroxylase-like FAD-dependent oxidoreductase